MNIRMVDTSDMATLAASKPIPARVTPTVVNDHPIVEPYPAMGYRRIDSEREWNDVDYRRRRNGKRRVRRMDRF